MKHMWLNAEQNYKLYNFYAELDYIRVMGSAHLKFIVFMLG